MRLVRSADSLEFVRRAYEEGGELVLTSMQVRVPQKEMIAALADHAKLPQAAVLRMILDEWCAMYIEPDKRT